MLLLRKQQNTLSLQISRMARLPDVLPVLRPKRARLPDCRMARLPDFTQKAVRFQGKEQIKDRDIVTVSLMSFPSFTGISRK